MKIDIQNLTRAQEIAIEDLLATWVALGDKEEKKWTSFLVDVDFRPSIRIDDKEPQFTNLYPRNYFISNNEYRIDYDAISWKLNT